VRSEQPPAVPRPAADVAADVSASSALAPGQHRRATLPQQGDWPWPEGAGRGGPRRKVRGDVDPGRLRTT